MTFRKLQFPVSDHKRGRGVDWHYSNSSNLYTAPKKDSIHPLPAGLLRHLFPGYKAVCAVYDGDFTKESPFKLCAVPENGGPYLVLDDIFSQHNISKLDSEESLGKILIGMHWRNQKTLERLSSDQLAKIGLEIAEQPEDPCTYCSKENITEGFRDSATNEIYCHPLCFLLKKHEED
ncbi:hypothetical protein GF371_04385 [Candidatus Woesearchaeota archaeon]|nr:hypothetical protein [Candidatus Woesearchaeota archaeon]